MLEDTLTQELDAVGKERFPRKKGSRTWIITEAIRYYLLNNPEALVIREYLSKTESAT
jgi:metal-responsive CopG/Arc/MetJ family transcriptional regulator